MGLVIGLVKFGVFGAIICGVLALVLSPFAFLLERASSAKFAKDQKAWADRCNYTKWEDRVKNAVRGTMLGRPDYWEPALILESMSKPGHNERVFCAVHATYTLEQLGKAGLVAGDGSDLRRWIANQKVAQQEAMGRWNAKEQAIKDATAANAARWEEPKPEPVTHQSPARMGMTAITTNPKNRKRLR
ncbi:hypothetical protein [Aeromonas phage 32]|nr:hypothetical protein [Aeromonas phage 32]